MLNIKSYYKAIRSNRFFYIQLLVGLLLLIASLYFNHLANNYTASHYTTGISDIILDHIPTLNVEYAFLEGALTLAAFVVLLAFYKPQRLPYLLKTLALFVIIRAFFVSLTHLGPPLSHALFYPQGFLEKLIYGSGEDLFFSGHTGFPFLMALVFWENKPLRWIFLFASLFFGVSVLLGHLHYSIDVFSAFFICYGIFRLSTLLFKKDYLFFNNTL